MANLFRKTKSKEQNEELSVDNVSCLPCKITGKRKLEKVSIPGEEDDSLLTDKKSNIVKGSEESSLEFPSFIDHIYEPVHDVSAREYKIPGTDTGISTRKYKIPVPKVKINEPEEKLHKPIEKASTLESIIPGLEVNLPGTEDELPEPEYKEFTSGKHHDHVHFLENSPNKVDIVSEIDQDVDSQEMESRKSSIIISEPSIATTSLISDKEHKMERYKYDIHKETQTEEYAIPALGCYLSRIKNYQIVLMVTEFFFAGLLIILLLVFADGYSRRYFSFGVVILLSSAFCAIVVNFLLGITIMTSTINVQYMECLCHLSVFMSYFFSNIQIVLEVAKGQFHVYGNRYKLLESSIAFGFFALITHLISVYASLKSLIHIGKRIKPFSA